MTHNSGQWRHGLDLGHAPVFIESFETTFFSRFVMFLVRIFSAMPSGTLKIQEVHEREQTEVSAHLDWNENAFCLWIRPLRTVVLYGIRNYLNCLERII